MAGYSPLRIAGFETGLIQNREEFLLPDDAYPTLNNAYIWRERIKRKRGHLLLGRLQRSVDVTAVVLVDNTGQSVNLITALSLESTASIVPGSVNVTGNIDGTTYTDPASDGVLVASLGTGTGGTINYATGVITINAGGGESITGTVQYYPGLPSMGINVRELDNSAIDQTVFFDQKYAYIYNAVSNVFQEFIPGTTWNVATTGIESTDFFWSTNYWTASANTPFAVSNNKLFWVTNNSGGSIGGGDPPRITDGVAWVDFTSGAWHQIDATNYLFNWLSMLPFRGRMVTFNTWEGSSAGSATHYRQRIRWATIGNPFIPYAAGPPATGSWRSDIRGQGGYLDIPTAEDIVLVGFVRDNLTIFCEKSTWQLRYTGRSIAPFQIEKVNSELGSESPYSGVQFDTSISTIGQRGIVDCDSYKCEKIDPKIPDLVFGINVINDGEFRIQGIRDYEQRLAYWTLPLSAKYDSALGSDNYIFPNTRLVYNYENESWATFDDSYTTLGQYQAQSGRNWINTKIPWIKCNFPWIDRPKGKPLLVAGNQQGFIEQINQLTVNDVSLYISNITGNTTTPTKITCPSHNMNSGTVINIKGVLGSFSTLNGGVYAIDVVDKDSFLLYTYNSSTQQFSDAQLNATGTYTGAGLISIRDNFSIVSKKFNFLDDGQSIQMGFIDILMESTGTSNPGFISLFTYLDYDNVSPINTLSNNQINNGSSPVIPDTFFNSVIPTSPSSLFTPPSGTKFWQRVFCATRGNFITLQYTFSNAQMAGEEQQQDVQIDAQILWIRKAGRLSQL